MMYWILLLVIINCFLWPIAGLTREVTLAWDTNKERYLGGYRIYYGNASRSYNQILDVGNKTTYTITDLSENLPYYFAITAYNRRNIFESEFSNEVSIGASRIVVAHQESPSAGSFESGVGLIRGWVCNANVVEVEIDGGERLKTAYGTLRSDTTTICGTANTGYGLPYNWNNLGSGLHTLRVFADGIEFDRVSFYVTTLGEPYLQGLNGEYILPNFPSIGKQVTVRWSEAHQNFVITGMDASTATNHNYRTTIQPDSSSVLGHQESPSTNSYESGISLIRGWVCNASMVEIEIDGRKRLRAGYGTLRPDTAAVCGTPNTGYGLPFNWNSLEDGLHNLKVFADGVEFANINFTITTLGQAFWQGLPPYEHTLVNFPTTGHNTTLRWSESHQNFVIVNFQ